MSAERHWCARVSFAPDAWVEHHIEHDGTRWSTWLGPRPWDWYPGVTPLVPHHLRASDGAATVTDHSSQKHLARESETS